MKVGTDSVLLGSWVSVKNVRSVLDIGCGTALLSLMVAQRQEKTLIVGLEIDEDALIDAKANCLNSLWNDRVKLQKGDFMLTSFDRSFDRSFDLIISNPPFFLNDTLSPIKKRSLARNGQEHSFLEWVLKAKHLLSKNGIIGFVLPIDQWLTIEKDLKSNGLFVKRICKIRPKEYKDHHRVMVELVLDSTTTIEESALTIEKEKRHDYTKEYKELTASFYLSKD